MAGRVSRGDVRLYEFASPDKRRPVVVLTRDGSIGLLATVTVAPITSTIRGAPSEIVLNEEDGMKAACAVNLHNISVVPLSRIGKLVAQLNASRMREICGALRFAVGCE